MDLHRCEPADGASESGCHIRNRLCLAILPPPRDIGLEYDCECVRFGGMAERVLLVAVGMLGSTEMD